MARFLQGLFGGKPTSPPATAARINTSLQGVPIPILLGGRVRVAGSWIDYFNFFSVAGATSGGGGGKGGTFGGGGKGQQNGTQYYASCILSLCQGPINFLGSIYINGSVQQTPILPQPNVNLIPGSNPPIAYEIFLGTLAQLPWDYATAFDIFNNPTHLVSQSGQPTRARAYRGITYLGFENYPLGTSPTLPSINAEVISPNFNALPPQHDGNITVATTTWLTDPLIGTGFPASRLGSLSDWNNFCLAMGLVVSPFIASPIAASALLTDFCTATASEACWQNGQLTIVPHADTAITAGTVTTITETHQIPATNVLNPFLPIIVVGNSGTYAADLGVTYHGSGIQLHLVTAPITLTSPGVGQYYQNGGTYYFNPGDTNAQVDITYSWAATASYVPPIQNIYDFTLDDFVANQGTLGQGRASTGSPLLITRKSRSQMLNNIKIEYLDRNNNYNPVDIEMKDEASITAFKRERPSSLRQHHFFCLGSAAQQSATLQLIREQIARKFQFTVGRHFMLILNLMSVCTVSDPNQGLFRQGVRILEILENNDATLTITAEEFTGTISAPLYGIQAPSGLLANENVDPGPINTPIVFEPTDQLGQTMVQGGGLLIATAVSGQNTALWGGCEVWASYDGINYQRQGRIVGAARMGVLTADCPIVPINPTGQTVDVISTLQVNLAESIGTLNSGSQLDVTSLNTRCYVGGEIIAYKNAQLLTANNYSLTYLIRGAYSSTIADHPAGTPFARLDQQIEAFPYDSSRVGSTLYLKFPSFNIWQGGLESLSSVPAVTYVITGAALLSPMPDVQNLRELFDINTGFTEITWDEITDFRAHRYEVRSGASLAASYTLGSPAHPPFRIPGDGTYWVAAVSTPVSGATVYSADWANITISGAVITQNVIVNVNLKTLGWPGTFTGGAGVDNSINAIRTGGGNILTDANILTTPDIINFGGGTSAGIYFPDAHAFIDAGYVVNASIVIKYQPTGVPINQNILNIGNILTTSDILGSASTKFITVYPRIQIGVFSTSDLYALPTPGHDLYATMDLYAVGIEFGPWQVFSAGTYQARYFNFSMFLQTIDPNTIAYDLEFTIVMTIPARIDTQTVTTSAAGTVTITFAPTGQGAAPFNGGAGAGNTPIFSVAIRNAQAGDLVQLISISLASVKVAVVNAGSNVVRTVDLIAQGF